MKNRSLIVYGSLVAAWGAVTAWQIAEHRQLEQESRTEARTLGRYITGSLGRMIRSQRPFLWDEKSGKAWIRRNEVEAAVKAFEGMSNVLSLAILNQEGVQVAQAGAPIENLKGIFQSEEVIEPIWDDASATVLIVNLMELASPSTNGTPDRVQVVSSPPEVFGSSNAPAGSFPPQARRGAAGPPAGADASGGAPGGSPLPPLPGAEAQGLPNGTAGLPPAGLGARGDAGQAGLQGGHGARGAFGRPGSMPPGRYDEIMANSEKNEVHGLGIVLSTRAMLATISADSFRRGVVSLFAAASAIGLALAYGASKKYAELESRLAKTSALNSQLREMNLAAAGLAHETRNPLNIARGLAQMLSKTDGESANARTKGRQIMEEVDRVSGQLSEFIDYSKPREIKKTSVDLGNVVGDVARALRSDMEDKKIVLYRTDDDIAIEADQPMLRQILFNLLLNAIQAVDKGGQLQVDSGKNPGGEAWFEIRDDGPGVPCGQREEIFKPYFTIRREGTGLGLAVVKQMVEAQEWEIQCLPNGERGAVFRVSRVKRSPKR